MTEVKFFGWAIPLMSSLTWQMWRKHCFTCALNYISLTGRNIIFPVLIIFWRSVRSCAKTQSPPLLFPLWNGSWHSDINVVTGAKGYYSNHLLGLSFNLHLNSGVGNAGKLCNQEWKVLPAWGNAYGACNTTNGNTKMFVKMMEDVRWPVGRGSSEFCGFIDWNCMLRQMFL